MPRQDKLTRKFEIWQTGSVTKLLAAIDAPDLEAARRWAVLAYPETQVFVCAVRNA